MFCCLCQIEFLQDLHFAITRQLVVQSLRREPCRVTHGGAAPGKIIKKNEDKWDELVQLLMDFRGSIEENRERQAEDLGLSETEFAFHNILKAELSSARGIESFDEDTNEAVKEVVRRLVSMMDEASQIVDFFNKWDEQKRVRVQIKRAIMDSFDESMVKPVTERFMELAKVKFK